LVLQTLPSFTEWLYAVIHEWPCAAVREWLWAVINEWSCQVIQSGYVELFASGYGQRFTQRPRAGDHNSLAERGNFLAYTILSQHQQMSTYGITEGALKGQNTQPPLCHSDQDSKSAVVIAPAGGCGTIDLAELIRVLF
jgi:hypothetical protein